MNGAVILIKGDISRDRFTKQKIIHKDNLKHPITGFSSSFFSINLEKKKKKKIALGFRDQIKTTYLFVASTNAIDVYVTQGKDQKEELDSQGCELNCGIVSETEQEMVLGKADVIISFSLPFFSFFLKKNNS